MLDHEIATQFKKKQRTTIHPIYNPDMNMYFASREYEMNLDKYAATKCLLFEFPEE
jgi:hypothetical protein